MVKLYWAYIEGKTLSSKFTRHEVVIGEINSNLILKTEFDSIYVANNAKYDTKYSSFWHSSLNYSIVKYNFIWSILP